MTAILAAIAAGAGYLGYRAAHTLNPEAWAFSVAVLAAEALLFLGAALLLFDLWSPRRPQAPAPPEKAAVDVLVYSSGEDATVLRRTLQAVAALRYPHRTVLLDDAMRPETAALAREMSVECIARSGRAHGRTGALNHALAHSSANFTAIIDAGDVPAPDFLDRTLGFFADDRVGFVQVAPPALAGGPREGPHALFDHAVQPGKQRWDAALLCGTAAVLRCAAAADVGGLSIHGGAGDVRTSLRFHARGWRSVYIDEHLVSTLCLRNAGAPRLQGTRWPMWDRRLLGRGNPLVRPGLSIPQRLSYLATLWPWVAGLAWLVLFAAPGLMLLTAASPVRKVTLELLALFAFSVLARWAGLLAASGGRWRPMADASFHLRWFWPQVRRAAAGALGRDSQAGESAALAFLVLLWCFSGLCWGALRYWHGLEADTAASGLAGFWCVFFGAMAAHALMRQGASAERRGDRRAAVALPVAYRVPGEHAPAEQYAIADDYGPDGMTLLCFHPLPLQETFDVALMLGARRIVARAQAQCLKRPPSGDDATWAYGVAFVGADSEDRALLAKQRKSSRITEAAGNPSPAMFWTRRKPWRCLPMNLDPQPGVWTPARLASLQGLTARLVCGVEPHIHARSDFLLLSRRGEISGSLRVLSAEERSRRGARYWEWSVAIEPADAASADRLTRLGSG